MCSTLAPDAALPDGSGGAVDDPSATLTPDDCHWLGNRIERMMEARPRGADLPHEQATGEEEDSGAIEGRQLVAFENAVEEWWLIVTEADLSAALLALTGEGESDCSFAQSQEEREDWDAADCLQGD